MTTLPADHHVADSHEHAHDHGHEHHHDIGFIRKYFFSMDHKVIGIQFLFTSLAFLLVGGLLALAVRWQIAWPFDRAQPIPIYGGKFDPATQASVIGGEFYNMLFTMHATFMIFFVIIPMLVGAFGNVLIPLMIGTRDMAFPLLNMLSYWLALAAGLVMTASFFIETVGPNGPELLYNQTAQGGWTSYPPLSTIAFSPGWGQTLWVMSLMLVGSSSLMGAVNYLTTILNLRCPGMTLFRMPLTIWALFITSILILMSTPVITAALLMLLFDRHFGTSFFIISDAVRAGSAASTLDSGQPLLYQHLFWFYSHPAVYIMILPSMGMASDVLATFSRKPIFGYKPMVFAIAGIAGLGFIVWGHHMFASGMNPILGTTFMASTMMIALPSAIKTFNWLGTMWGGQIRYTPAMLFGVGFVAMFVIGGLSGIFMANAPVDIYFHDTYFIVGHIHYVLFGGSLFGIFSGIYYWYPKMFGRNMNSQLGVLHFWFTFIAFNVTFFAMHIIGIGGHPRRYATIMQYPSLEFLQPLNIFMTIGALMLLMAQLPFVVNMFCSLGRFGNRIIVYPVLLALLELTPFGPVGLIFGSELAPLFQVIGLILVFVAMGFIDMAIVRAMGTRDSDRISSLPATLTWIAAFPLFVTPIFAKGDFWEWIGVNSTTFVIQPDQYARAPMQPYPTAVDPDTPETVGVVQISDGEGGFIDAETPQVTEILVNYTGVAQAADRASVDLSTIAAFQPAVATRSKYNQIRIETAALATLPENLQGWVNENRVMVPAWIAEVEKQELLSNQKVSRTFQSKRTGEFFIVTWTNVRLGWIIVLLTGVFGLAILMRRNTYLNFGDKVGSNPWKANSLEWYATSPPWYENFPDTPTVYRGAYEFSSPAAQDGKDYLPQWEKLPEGVEEPSGH